MRVLPWLAEASPESAWAGKHHGEVCNASLKLLGGKQETAEKGWLGGIPTCCWGKEASRLGLTLRQR